MFDEERVVRPPEFKKVLEELHVVRLGDNLKREIQARRDLEDVYHRLLQNVTDLEEMVERGRVDVERATGVAQRASYDQAQARTENVTLRRRLTRMKVACFCLIAAAASLLAFSWTGLVSLYPAIIQFMS